MSNSRWITALTAVSILAAFGGYEWAHRSARNADAAASDANPSTMNGQSGTGSVLYWHDPMKPEIRFDKPGKSPFMDMPLVPVYATGSANAGGITVSPDMRQSLGIRLGRVERSVLESSIAAVGAVAYDEHLTTLIQVRAAGYIDRLHVKAAQDRVRRGQVLAEVTVPEWIEAEGEYLALLRADSTSAVALRAAARERLLLLGVPETAVRAIEQQRQTQESTSVVAPIDGVVTELGVRDGGAFAKDAVLYRINGLGTVWVDAQVPESQAGLLVSGDSADVRATAWPGLAFRGNVEAVLPQLDSATRTLTVRVVADNRAGKLGPGMFVNVEFKSPKSASELWVPSEAVITTGERSVVIRQHENGAFAAVDVRTGRESNGRTAILAGLSEGETIVLSGQFLIDSEASLKSAINRLSASPGSAAGEAP